MKKLFLFMLITCLALTVFLVGCAGNSDTTTADDSTSATADDSTTGGDSEALDSTTDPAVESTPAESTGELTENGIPISMLCDASALIGTKDFKNEGLALMKLIIRDYYNKSSNAVLDKNGNRITLWAVGSFLEAVTSVYKAFPDDAEIKRVYTGLLDRGLRSFKVVYQKEQVNGVTPYYYNASAGGRDDYYYDDDEWIALQYLEAYKLLGDEKYLTLAQEILEFVWLGWGLQSNEKIENGGIPWHINGNGPTTCSNAPAAYAFAIFSTLTEDKALAEEYLTRSITVYDWVRKYLSNGSIYRDSYDITKNTTNDWSGSYNNGVMIAVGSLLYTITGEDDYYRQASMTARNATTTNMKTENGRPEFENDIENPWMNAWLVKGFIEFYKVDKNHAPNRLNRCAEIMAFALDNKLESGYLRIQLDEDGEKTWTEDGKTIKNDHPSTDCVNLGGGVSLLMILAEWAELYGRSYQ